MSLVSVLTRELGRNHRHPVPAGVTLADVDSGASQRLGASPNGPVARATGSSSTPEVALGLDSGDIDPGNIDPGNIDPGRIGLASVEVASPAARRIAAGHVGDPLALDGYVDRAWRLAALSFGAGSVMAALAVTLHPAGWLPASLLALGAGFDWARGRHGARVLIQGGVLVVRRGPWGGTRLRRDDIECIGFGARARSGQRPPEAFLRGDFESAGASHLVVLRLKGKRPRRLIVPEAGVGEARAAVSRLRHWMSSARS